MMYKPLSLSEQHRLLLSKGFRLEDPQLESVQLVYCPSFSQDFALQLAWNSRYVETLKITSYPDKNQARLQRGFMQRADLEPILRMLRSLNVPLALAWDGRSGRDGAIIEFSHRYKNYSYTFSWWDCDTPPAWEALDQLKEEILSLEKTLEYQKEEMKQVTIQMEQEETDQSIWIEIEGAK